MACFRNDVAFHPQDVRPLLVGVTAPHPAVRDASGSPLRPEALAHGKTTVRAVTRPGGDT